MFWRYGNINLVALFKLAFSSSSSWFILGHLFCPLRSRHRRRSGAVDVVARVAAVSPIISVRKAPPLFMVEVEQADQHRQQRQHQQRRQQHQRQERSEERFERNILDPLQADGRPSPSSSRSSQRPPPPPPPERDFAEFSRSPEEISALFAAPQPSRATSRGGGALPREQRRGGSLGDDGINKRLRGVQPEENRGGRREALAAGQGEQVPMPMGGVGARNNPGGLGESEKGGEGGRPGLPSASRREEQLMTRLVLTGPRCLAWHSVIVPGKTYVFPGIGAFVLGSGDNTYRAFGDAKGRSGRGSSGSSSRRRRNGGGVVGGGGGSGGGGGERGGDIAGKGLATPVRLT